MYAVSNDYKQAIKQPIIQSRVGFEIAETDYTEEHILAGSFSITNQNTDTSDIKLGAVYIGELKATFINMNIPRNAWRGKEIAPYFELLTDAGDPEQEIAPTWERVPLGVFTITEATHSRSGVSVKAYDNMRLFDQNHSLNQASGYLYDFLLIAANSCNVLLAQTENQIKALPNGTQFFTYYSENDVETWRDLLSWIAQTLGGYATINRQGRLEIRTFGTQSIDTLTPANRHEGGVFSDYITKYTGLSYVDIEAQTTRYYAAAVDDGITMNLGSNPFLQNRIYGVPAIGNLLNVLANIQYTPFKVSTVNNPAYDLGDVLTFSGGLAGTTATCCVMKYEFSNHDKMALAGYGADPDKANAKSKTDKNLAGLLSETRENTMAFYELRNVNPYRIGDGASRKIVHIKMATNVSTRVQIHININLLTSDTDEDEITKATVTYILDGNTLDVQPEETYIDGNHIMHLMFILPMSANQIEYFEVMMKADGGTINIDRQGLWFYASGLGIVGDERWDGEFEFEDLVEDFHIYEPDFISGISDTVQFLLITPTKEQANDNIQLAEIPTLAVGDLQDALLMNKIYISGLRWIDANELSWANAYQDYIWGETE